MISAVLIMDSGFSSSTMDTLCVCMFYITDLTKFFVGSLNLQTHYIPTIAAAKIS